MNLLETVYERAKQDVKKVGFCEADNEKILMAAYETTSEKFIQGVLVGDENKLRQLCRQRQYDEELFEYFDCSDEEKLEHLALEYEKMPGVFIIGKSLRRRMKDPMYVSLILEALGKIDVTFAGIDHTTGDVIVAGQSIVGMKDGISVISSVGIADIPGFKGGENGVLAIGDSAVCANPTSEQLADIAISSCETVKSLFGWEERCALVSYSTLGSGSGELIDKVTEAVRIANEKRPDLNIEGEFQIDAAINETVAEKKVRTDSKVAGKANIVIWPDLNVGNVGVKLIQQLTGANAYGPILQGFKKVVCDCSRGAPVEELKGNIILSAIRVSGE